MTQTLKKLISYLNISVQWFIFMMMMQNQQVIMEMFIPLLLIQEYYLMFRDIIIFPDVITFPAQINTWCKSATHRHKDGIT